MSALKPKIAVIGYGRMGKIIEDTCFDRKLDISAVYDIDYPLKECITPNFDVAIDFSAPSSVKENIETLCKLKRNMVIGTTGWDKHKEELELLIKEAGIGAVISPNFSIGMLITRNLVRMVAQFQDKFGDYDIFLSEMHHKNKVDMPSGTALALANDILKNTGRKNSIAPVYFEGKIETEQLHVSSLRGGDISGKHSIFLDSEFDTIEISHNAKNNKGLALGAVISAEFIHGKSGIFSFEEVIDSIST